MATVSMGPQCASLLNGVKSVHMNDSAKESQRQRELEEARARAAQMVKTMKWWSECTANWREKWIKVRNERNKAREEVKQLRSSLEAALKKANTYKQEKQELELQVAQFKQKMEHTENDSTNDVVGSEDSVLTKTCQESVNESTELKDEEEKQLLQQLSTESDINEAPLVEKINRLVTDMEQAEQIIKSEQNCKMLLQKNVEKLQKENAELLKHQEQLYSSKQEAVRELLTIQELHRAEINIVNKALQEEMKIRENLEKSLIEKRNELDHVHKHQNEEFCRRERLETEKLALERRNKMLSTEVRYYQDLFDHKGFPNIWRCERCGNTRPSSGAF